MPLKEQDKPELVTLVGQGFKARDLNRYFGNLTMAVAMNSNTPTVWRLVRKYGDAAVPKIAKVFITASIYVGQPMSQEEAEAVMYDILGDYELSQLKMEDLVVIYHELKALDTNRNRLTANTVLNHVKGYWERRINEAKRQSLDTTLQQKNHDADINERIKKTIALPDAQGKRIDRTRTDVNKYYK